MKPVLYFYTSLLVIISFLIIYYLYKIMTNKPVYAIAVFNDSIKGTVKFSEDLTFMFMKQGI